MVLDLLFILCLWHAYAKLWLHTSSTLQALADTTKALGAQIRLWVKKMCTAFDTHELPKEESARHRWKATAATWGKSGMASRDLTQCARGCSRNATSSQGTGKSKVPTLLKALCLIRIDSTSFSTCVPTSYMLWGIMLLPLRDLGQPIIIQPKSYHCWQGVLSIVVKCF